MPCGICDHEEADEYLIPSNNHRIIEIDLCLECGTLSNEEIIEKIEEGSCTSYPDGVPLV